MQVFYRINNVPTHSVLLMPTREIAMNYPKGNIALGFCKACGFIFNVEFESGKHEYSSRCEETQGFSPTFNAFAKQMALYLIERYDLHNKEIIEIGCGKGEFLTLLCTLGGNRGIGFDPGYVNGRNKNETMNRITFINDFYSEKYAACQGDFICCRMTLEHIQPTADFLNTIRRSIGNRKNTIVFFQVPNVTRILREQAFWDIYYEHCSYFSPGSLARLFRKCSFDVVNIWKDYDDQYLMIEARLGKGTNMFHSDIEETTIALSQDVLHFSKDYKNKLDVWKLKLQKTHRDGRKLVVWGSGSKGVAFLTTLEIQSEIEYVADINPYKNGMYMAGTGQRIVSPDFLQKYKPDTVIVMNPMYVEEIRQDLNRMGLFAEIITV